MSVELTHEVLFHKTTALFPNLLNKVPVRSAPQKSACVTYARDNASHGHVGRGMHVKLRSHSRNLVHDRCSRFCWTVPDRGGFSM